MSILTLTPDQPCNWHKIEDLLQKWNSSTLLHAPPAKAEARFFTQLPADGQGRFSSLLELQETLRPYGISFSLEISP
ncbi:MAG: hypothetical protein PF442_02590 [Desulfobulbaceae bacterium]|jgi:hypothetical protein|nr:hypothetical protein [Desulfobulbaceae bacterium]